MRYLRQKLVHLLIVFVAVTFVTFIAVDSLPGDPVLFRAGPGATEEQLDEIRKDLGLDKPLPVQYAIWVRDTATLDLGLSLAFNTPVKELIIQRLPVTLVIMFYAQLLSLALAIPVGAWAANRNGGPFDRASNTVAFGLLSVPNYIMGVLLVFLLATNVWHLLPGISKNISLFEDPVLHFKYFLLPVLTLAIPQFAGYMRLVRQDMITTLQSDFIVAARAKGLSTPYILARHAFRPSTFSLVTAAAINIGALIGGSLIVEQIFALNGMGSLIVEAIFRRDYPVVQTCVAIFAVGFVLINFVVDLLYAYLDPRIRHARALA